MKSELSGLVRLKKGQVRSAAEVVVRAFYDDPLAVYLFPDVAEREIKLPRVFEPMVRYCHLYGGACATSANLEGIIVWLPSERAHRTLWRNIRSGHRCMLFRIGRRAAAKLKALDAYVAAMQKRHASSAYCYGLLLAVDPAYQGKGYGGVLLKALLADIDRQGRPCYMETFTQKDASFFRHFGFEVVEKCVVPGTELKVLAMMRKND
jgi:GNAT superfamily N-acetyltransferase